MEYSNVDRRSKHSEPHVPGNESGGAQFVDSRGTTASQFQLRALMHANPQAAAQRKQQLAMRPSVPSRQPPIQCKGDEELLQGEFATEAPAQLQRSPTDTGLPDQLRAGIESLSGISMDSVKVHYNSANPAQLNAHAYAQGPDIHVAPGQERHLPHEAWHVVQQAQGRVKPTLQAKGVPVNDDVSLEREADQMGARALQAPSRSLQLHADHGAQLAAINRDIAEATQGATLQQREAIQREVNTQLQGRFLVDDGQVADGRVGKSQFLADMRTQVLEISQRILGPYGLAQDDCPDLKYWVSHYEGKDAGYVENVIARYAPATQDAKDSSEYLSLLVARIEAGLIEHTRTGAEVDPEPMPDSIDQQRQPLSVLGIQRMENPVAQLGCASSNSALGEDKESKGEKEGVGKEPDSDAIAKIKKCNLSAIEATNIGSSRPKLVYFFDAGGNNVPRKASPAYMIDTSMSPGEIANYEKVRKMGIRVPKIYGSHSAGTIVQFLPNQVTVTAQLGGLARGVERTINQLKRINKWNPDAWRAALPDLDVLIKTGYSSPDLQFMVDNDGGHIYVMDMEPDKAPSFDASSDSELRAAKAVIEENLAV